MRKGLIVLLGLGVLAGYGSALGHMRHRWHGGAGGPYEGGCDRWSQQYDEPAQAPVVTAPAPAPAPVPAPVQQQPVVPQIIIVQPQAAPAGQAPVIVVQQPAQAPQTVQPIIVQPQAAPAPAAQAP